MRLKYDLNVGALCVRLSDKAVARTREIDDNTFVDLDEAGGVVGIEVISISHAWALDVILGSYDIPAYEVTQLRSYFRPQGLNWEAPQVSAAPAPAVLAVPVAV